MNEASTLAQIFSSWWLNLLADLVLLGITTAIGLATRRLKAMDERVEKTEELITATVDETNKKVTQIEVHLAKLNGKVATHEQRWQDHERLDEARFTTLTERVTSAFTELRTDLRDIRAEIRQRINNENA